MKTHIDIEATLLADVMQMGSFASKKAAVHAALSSFLNELRRKDLLALRGKLDWQGNLDELRADRRDRWT